MNKPIGRRVATGIVSFSLAVAAAGAASFASAQAPMPQPHTQGGVTYLSGGAGSEEVSYMKAQAKDYTLALLFSVKGGDYAANVAVSVKDGRGETVFEAPSTGPYLLLKLPAGRYTVVATYKNNAKTRIVSAQQPPRAPVDITWS